MSFTKPFETNELESRGQSNIKQDICSSEMIITKIML
jgi:hypothetical protein